MRISRLRRPLHFVVIILFFLVFLQCFLLSTAAQEQNSLFIVMYDHESVSETPLDENVVFAGASYDVVIGYNVSTPDGEWDVGIANNVTVTVPWADPSYIGMDPPYATIEIPTSYSADSFMIVASKPGYTNAEEEYLILQGKLMLSLNYQVLEEHKEVIVSVNDQNNNPVEGVTVYLDGFESDKKITDSNGKAILTTPEVAQETTVSVFAYKDRYDGTSETITILNTTVVQSTSLNQLIPIILSLLAVIFAIGFVRYRKNRYAKLSPDVTIRDTDGIKQVYKNKNEDVFVLSKQKVTTSSTEHVRPPSVIERSPRVEEIRIHEPQVKKEIDTLTSETPSEKSSPKKKDNEEWFHGTDYMRGKIDEITGEIDVHKDGKWFEGIDDVRSKVDEKLKQRSKKKNEENNK